LEADEMTQPRGPAPPETARVISLRAGGDGADHQGGGWSYPEAEFCWTLGYQSELTLPAPDAPGAIDLVFDLFPFTAGAVAEQPLTISVNGVEIAASRIRGGGRVACRVAADIVARARPLAVTLHHPGAARPSDLRPGEGDQRLLALAVRAVTLRPAPNDQVPNDQVAQDQAPHARQPDPNAPAQRDPPPPPAPHAAASRHALMLGFESLGMNCELGLVQRHAGAEPLGLLRFAFSPVSAILAGLADRFEQIGRPDTTAVRLHAPSGEYQVLDRAYGFLFHTWIYRDAGDAAELHRRECRRLPRLARKLVETLEEAEKILVFRGEASTTEREVREIVAAARRYGGNRVLWVRAAEAPEDRAGTARDAGEGLLMGWVDRLAPMQDAAKFSLESWIGMLEGVRGIAPDVG
jgi:hypothetical protein